MFGQLVHKIHEIENYWDRWMYVTRVPLMVPSRFNTNDFIALVIIIIIMSWDDRNRLKFSGKTNRLRISLQSAYFYYFGQFREFSDISDRNLIIFYKFT